MLILVTGNAGRLGSVLVPELIGNGHSIKGIDFSNGTPENLLNTPIDRYKNVDCVLHLAAMTSVENCEIDPLRAEELNVLATKKAIAIAAENKCPLLFLSSAAVYGNDGSPMSVYGKTKLAAENLIRESDLSYAILRLFNVITFDKQGPALIPSVQRAIESDELIYLYGDGSSTRDFISVHSVVNLIIDIIENNKYENDTYDVGSGKSVSVLSVITSIAFLYEQMTGTSARIFGQPPREKEITHSVAKVRKIKQLCPSVKINDFYSTLIMLQCDTIYPTSREKNG